ncbi:MAG TPA: MTH938/NDUFAF3 family protein, partial [Burkholderiales bacterium]|nr:MTH938/NDUFAF3 family protein [Burkholderiales bacterium]
MKLHQSSPAGRNAFTGYGEGYVQVNGDRFDSSILVLPDAPVRAWEVATLAELDEPRVAELARLEVEIVLIGTGPALRFP